MTNEQLFLEIGIPIVFNGFLIGIMWTQLSNDIREVRADLKVIVGKIYNLESRLSRVEDKLGIVPRQE